MSQNDSGADVAEKCRDLLCAGVVGFPNPGLGLARRQGEVLGIGWHHVSPEQVGGRSGDVLLEGILSDSILRLNPALEATPDRVRAVVGEVRRIVGMARTGGIGAARSELVPWILGQRALPGRIYVRLVDLGDVEQNSFVVTEHQPVEAGGGSGEPGFVLYVNGIPVVVLETETPVPGQEPEEPEPAPAAAPEPADPPEAAAGEAEAAVAGETQAGEAEAAVAGETGAGEAEVAGEAATAGAAGETAGAGAGEAAPDPDAVVAAAGALADAAATNGTTPGDGAAAVVVPAAPTPAPPPSAPKAPRPGTWQHAASRIIELQEQVPELFVANLMTAATDGHEFHHAATGVALGDWQHWDPGAGVTGGDRVGVAVKTVLRPDALLDLLASFAFGWEDE